MSYTLNSLYVNYNLKNIGAEEENTWAASFQDDPRFQIFILLNHPSPEWVLCEQQNVQKWHVIAETRL